MRLVVFNMAMDLDTPSREFMVAWVRRLAARVERVDVVTMRAGRVDVPENVRVHSLGKEWGYSEPRRAVEFYRHLGRLLREGRVDGCFSHMTPIFTLLAAPLLRARGIPIVTWYAHPSLTLVLRLAHHLSARMVTSVATAYPYRSDKLTVVGQGIDTDLFAPDGTPPDRPPLILCAGRLSPVKDHPTLLRAVSRLRTRWRDPLRVVVVGRPASERDEPYVRALRQLAADRDLEDVVTFAGAAPMRELPGWYRRCTVHVNLTPTGSGDKVGWEAMSCGRPCVAANEGYRDSLGEHADRLLFRHGDVEDLAGRLEWVLSLPAEGAARVGSHLRENVVKLHSLDRLAARLVDLFREIGAKNRGGG